MSALVDVQNLSKIYERGKQKIEVLHHVQLEIEARATSWRSWGRPAPARRRC